MMATSFGDHEISTFPDDCLDAGPVQAGQSLPIKTVKILDVWASFRWTGIEQSPHTRSWPLSCCCMELLLQYKRDVYLDAGPVQAGLQIKAMRGLWASVCWTGLEQSPQPPNNQSFLMMALF